MLIDGGGKSPRHHILQPKPVEGSIMKKAAGFFGMAVIILLMAAAVFTFLAPRFGWRVDAVYSGSMEPQLKVGGVVVTRPVAAEDVKAGDTITFYSPLNEQLTSHRVTAIKDGSPLSFQTKGDANEDADPFIVPSGNVVGEVCFHIPYFGYATQFIKSPLGLLLTLCLPGLIIIILEMRNIWRALTEQETERKYRIR
jgi:signal peptidase